MSYLYTSDVHFCKLAQHRNDTKKLDVKEKSNDAYSSTIRVQTTINHTSICFFPHNINVKETIFRARDEKGIARHIDASSVV